MAITLDGTDGITTTGLTSSGIDDNATSTALVIDSSNNVTVNDSTGASVLRVTSSDSSSAYLQFGDQSNGAVSSIQHDNSDNSVRINNNGAERMRITSDGYLLVGTTSITVNTTNFGTRIGDGTNVSLKSFRNAGGGSTCSAFGGNAGEARVMGDGDLQNTNNSYGGISDERLKSNIVDASSQLDDIMAVQVRSYTLDSTGGTHIGVVAQELEASGMSGLVDEDEEGMKSVKYSILYMKAIKALQEAVAKIEDLESRLSAVETN